MAASLNQAVSDFISGTNDSVAQSIASEINKNNAKFIDFIESLGQPLVGSPNDTVARGRATKLIGDVLALLPPSFLSDDQVQVVATFLMAKLGDHHSVQPAALHSLAALTNRCRPLPEGLPSQICLTIFREIQNQSLSHADRRNNYLIFQNLLGSTMQELNRMGGDFVIGFIQQMDAEKDPRNLLLVFLCAHHIISNIPLGAFTEEMFEVLGCYFPIEFTPPPNNPFGITKEELILALRKCLAASPDFSPFCLPLLLEKITSDLQSARLDAIETLVMCAPVFGRKGLTEYFGSITSALKREILMDISTELVQVSRDALTAVFKAMCPSQGVNSSQDDSLTTSMVEIYQDINKFLEGSNPKKACLAFCVCRAIASCSPSAFLTMIPLALPSVMKACSETSQDTDKILYLKEVNGAVDLMKTLSLSKEEKVKFGLSDTLCSLYQNNFDSDTCDSISSELIKGVTMLMTGKELISPEKSSAFMKALVQKGLRTNDKILRKEILVSIKHCLEANPNLSEETINSLQDIVNSKGGQHSVFDILSYAATDPESFHKTSSILLGILSKPLHDDEEWRGLEVVQSLGSLIENQLSTTLPLMVQTLALPLLRISLSLHSQWTEDTKDKCEQFMSANKDIFRLLANKISLSYAVSLWEKLSSVILDGNMSSIDYVGDTDLKPLQSSSIWQQTSLVAFLEGYLAGAHIQAFGHHSEKAFEVLFSLARDSKDDFTHLSACRCVAIIMNKATLGTQIHWLLEPITKQLEQSFMTQGEEASRRRCLQLWIWLTKALECRGHSAAAFFTVKLISMLEDPVLGHEAACGLGLLFEDLPSLLSLSLHSSVTPMYKQRVFNLNLKTLMEGYEENKEKGSPEITQHYLSAFSRITSNLPQQVLKPYLNKLVSLLFLSLDHLSGIFQQSTLSTLTNAVVYAPGAIVQSVDSLIPRLLSIARNDQKMAVRIAALECLEKVASLPIHNIAPHQNRIVKELAGTLDDRKRLVRMQAVETRNTWILIQQDKK